MSTFKPTIDAGQRRAIAERHGEPFSKSLSQLLKHPVSNEVDFDQLEALQLAEIAARLRLQIRDMIRDYRKLEKHWHLLHTELEHVTAEMRERKSQIRRPGFGEIRGMYAVYKQVWGDFLYALDGAARVQDLDSVERKAFQAGLRESARKQARRVHRAEKASQLASAMVTRSRTARDRKTHWTAL